MKKITLFFAALAVAFGASAQSLDLVDIPSDFTGDVQVLMADGVGLGGDNRAFTTNAGGWADLTPGADFICRAGGRDLELPGVVDLGPTYVYCVIKARIAPGQETAYANTAVKLGINENVWEAATKKSWANYDPATVPVLWTDGTNTVPAATTEWENFVFYIDGFTTTAWTGVGLEQWVAGILQIEDVWFATEKPVFGTVDVASVAAGKEILSVEYYSILGAKVSADAKGIVIVKTNYTDGSSSTQKVIK